MKIGIVFGCFIPLHQGHLSLINKAIQENDKVIIGVCGFDDDRGKDFISFKTRIELIKTKYKDNPNITVVSVDDKNIGLTGKFDISSWKIWSNELFHNANIQSNTEHITWYTGEQSYVDKLQEIYPKHNFCLVNRNKINISGTKIRENPTKYKEYIDKDFYTYLREIKNV